MKAQYLKLLIVMLLASMYNTLSSQSLYIDGRFCNNNQKVVPAKYMLMCNNKIIKTGKSRKIRVELALSTDYTLIISKEGFDTRVIKFSTQTQLRDNFVFLFDLILNETDTHKDRMIIPEKANVSVYYDTTINDFNYNYINKNQSSY